MREKILHAFFAIPLVGLCACSGSTPSSSAPVTSYNVYRSDDQLAADIRSALVVDERLTHASRAIHLEVRDGVAKLSGTVASEDQKRIIAEHAVRLVGADQVENSLKIETMPAGSAEPSPPSMDPSQDTPNLPPDQFQDEPQK